MSSLLDDKLDLNDKQIIINSLINYICYKNPIYTKHYSNHININNILINEKTLIKPINEEKPWWKYIIDNIDNLVVYYKLGNINRRIVVTVYLDNEHCDYKYNPVIMGGMYTLIEILDKKYEQFIR